MLRGNLKLYINEVRSHKQTKIKWSFFWIWITWVSSPDGRQRQILKAVSVMSYSSFLLSLSNSYKHSSSLTWPLLSCVESEQGQQESRRQCQAAGCQLGSTRGLAVAFYFNDTWLDGWRGGEVDISIAVARGGVAATSAFLSTAGILWRARWGQVKNRLVWCHL